MADEKMSWAKRVTGCGSGPSGSTRGRARNRVTNINTGVENLTLSERKEDQDQPKETKSVETRSTQVVQQPQETIRNVWAERTSKFNLGSATQVLSKDKGEQVVSTSGTQSSASPPREKTVEVVSATKSPSVTVTPNAWESRNRLLGLSNTSTCEVMPIVPNNGTQQSGTGTIPPKPLASNTSKCTVDTAASGPTVTVLKEINPKLIILDQVPEDTRKYRPLRSLRDDAPALGERISVKANHFLVTLDDIPLKLYHYDVVIIPKEAREKRPGMELSDSIETTVPDRLLPEIWKEFEARYHTRLGARMPFDGKKNCYSAKPLKLGPSNVWSDEMQMKDPDDDSKTRIFKIQLKLANEVNTSMVWTYLESFKTRERCELPQEVIQALDIALRYNPMINFTPCNRSFYTSKRDNETACSISDVLELWFGHNQSLLLGRDKRATLNVDMANKAFVKRMSVENLLRNLLRKPNESLAFRHWTGRNFSDADNFLRGKLIEYSTGMDENGEAKTHKFVCVKIINDCAKSYSFKIEGQETTIEKYFNSKQIALKHSEWPLVHVGNKNMTNYVPLELCNIIPQAYKGKLEAVETSNMIKGAAVKPWDRFKRIGASREKCQFDKCPILEEFGVKVSPTMLEIHTARKLPKPQIHFRGEDGKERAEAPKSDEGKFIIGRFLKGAVVPTVGVLNASGRNHPDFTKTVNEFLQRLGQEAFFRGMTTPNNTDVKRVFTSATIKFVNARMVRGSTTFDEHVKADLMNFKKQGVQLVLVIMSKDGKEYSVIKNEAEVQVGILTQCLKDDTLWKVANKQSQGRQSQILINILLKINAKLNGINFQLGRKPLDYFNFDKEPILILGADVTHPAPNSKSPSVAAVTASYDLSGTCYQMNIQAQTSTQEIITNLTNIVEQMLIEFREKTKRHPTRLIMFRDGVSEGQFNTIKETEYAGILKACTKFSSENRPKITFLVVKKRHHTRFVPIRPQDSVKPMGNIVPGTVVDTMITHPTEMEYFLNSHVGIQGTSKPTRYHIIHDDNNFTLEKLEQLTYCLCYTFVRCTHPVSYPAPTYYAHLAAFRARALLEKEGENADLQTLTARMTVKPELSSRYPMFFV